MRKHEKQQQTPRVQTLLTKGAAPVLRGREEPGQPRSDTAAGAAHGQSALLDPREDAARLQRISRISLFAASAMRR